MAIKNVSKKELMTSMCRITRSIWGKARGLMFSKPLDDKGLVMVFSRPKRIDLHMLFVFYPIDILWLDEEKKVVQMYVGAKPFQLHIGGKVGASYVVELPAGTIQRTGTTLQDHINFS